MIERAAMTGRNWRKPLNTGEGSPSGGLGNTQNSFCSLRQTELFGSNEFGKVSSPITSKIVFDQIKIKNLPIKTLNQEGNENRGDYPPSISSTIGFNTNVKMTS